MSATRNQYIDLQLRLIISFLNENRALVPREAKGRRLSKTAETVQQQLTRLGIDRHYSVSDGENGSFIMTENFRSLPEETAQKSFKTLQQHFHLFIAVLQEAATVKKGAKWQFFKLPSVDNQAIEAIQKKQQEKQDKFILSLFYHSLPSRLQKHVEHSLRVKLELTTAQEMDMGQTVTSPISGGIPTLLVSLPHETTAFDLVELLRLFPNRDGTRLSPTTNRPFKISAIEPNTRGFAMIRWRHLVVTDPRTLMTTLAASSPEDQQQALGSLNSDHLNTLLSDLSAGRYDQQTTEPQRKALQQQIARVIQYKDEHPPAKWKPEHAKAFFHALTLFPSSERMGILQHAWALHPPNKLADWQKQNKALWDSTFPVEMTQPEEKKRLPQASIPSTAPAAPLPAPEHSAPTVDTALNRLNEALKSHAAWIDQNGGSLSSLPHPHYRLHSRTAPESSPWIEAFAGELIQHGIIPKGQVANAKVNSVTRETDHYYYFFEIEPFDAFLRVEANREKLMQMLMTKGVEAKQARLLDDGPTAMPVPVSHIQQHIQDLNTVLNPFLALTYSDLTTLVLSYPAPSEGHSIPETTFELIRLFKANQIINPSDEAMITNTSSYFFFTLQARTFQAFTQGAIQTLMTAIAEITQGSSRPHIMQNSTVPPAATTHAVAAVPPPSLENQLQPVTPTVDTINTKRINLLSLCQQQANLHLTHAVQKLDAATADELKVIQENKSLTLAQKQQKLTGLDTAMDLATAVIREPHNSDALTALKNYATQEVPGQRDLSKQLIGALLGLVGAAILVLGIMGIPFTSGTSAIGLYVGSSLFTTCGVGLFYQGRKKGLAKAATDLAETAENRMKHSASG